MLAQKISPHLNKLASKSLAIKRQFYITDDGLNETNSCLFLDPLEEEKFTKVKGLIHKYTNRVLILLTLQCAAYCRFCTRQRCVSEIESGKITDSDLEKMKEYVLSKPKVKEVILSGGDPLMVPTTLIKALKIFSCLSQIKVIRIGTRIPVSEPRLINNHLLEVISEAKQPIYVLVNFEHPDELTKETIQAVSKLRKAGTIILSQTVFLAGVNDSFKVLYRLFSRLIEIGVKPYYLYRCDPVSGAEKFRVPFKKEIEIATKLREELSGLACPVYVIDTANGLGKIPVPLNFWRFDDSFHYDFLGKKQEII